MWYPWYRDKKERHYKVKYSAWQFDWINEPAAQYIARYMFPKYVEPFPSKVKHIFKTYLRGDMQITAVPM